MGQKRNKPARHITLTTHLDEYVDAQMDRLNISASEVIRRIMDAYLEYIERPGIIARMFAEAKRETEAEAAAEAAAVAEIAAMRQKASRRISKKIAA